MGLLDFSGGAKANKALKEKQAKLAQLRSDSGRFQYPTDFRREFDDLLEFTWRGLSFPVNNVTYSLAHEQVTHKFPHQNDALLETMGRQPLVISADCLFFNTLVSAPNETWQQGRLYPDVYREFLRAMDDGDTVDDLQHPFLGKLRCKPLNMESALTGEVRDGELLKCSWSTTLEANRESQPLADATSIAAATQTAAQADAFRPLPSELGLEQGPSFLDFMNAIQGLFDFANLFANQVKTTFNQPIGACNRILAAIERADDARHSTLEQVIRQHKTALLDLRKAADALQGERTIASLVLDRDMAITSAAFLPEIQPTNSILDLVRLNSTLILKGQVKAGSTLRYYSE